MSVYLRRIVSGKKARFKDHELDLELDLAYVTDQIIVMGFPAIGVESVYRNPRADVQRFLSARHDSDFWVFNFCPLRENAYPASVFEGRVSRYPFPDHHVPPFIYFPLVTREMHAWLCGSSDRVSVLHCKAGKGRSGTLACAYLLSYCVSPSRPISNSFHDGLSEWSILGVKDGLQTPLEASPVSPELPSTSNHLPARPGSIPPSADLPRVSSEPLMTTLEEVLDLHRSRRMKPSSTASRHSPEVVLSRKPNMGVSIPSQQRWLYYWSQILEGKGPPSLRVPAGTNCPTNSPINPTRSRTVKLTKLTIRMQELSGIQPHLVQAASAVITSTGKGRGVDESKNGRLWASLARYSDGLIDELKRWDVSGCLGTSTRELGPFSTDQWDKAKMIHSFARMGIADIHFAQESDDPRRIVTYVLRPKNEPDEEEWVQLIHDSPRNQTSMCGSSTYSTIYPPADESPQDPGIPLEPDREVRIKLFMGEVSLGWVWLIPAFHMSPDSPTATLVLSSDKIDFAIGFGKALVDMKISFASHDDHYDP